MTKWLVGLKGDDFYLQDLCDLLSSLELKIIKENNYGRNIYSRQTKIFR